MFPVAQKRRGEAAQSAEDVPSQDDFILDSERRSFISDAMLGFPVHVRGASALRTYGMDVAVN